MDPEQIGRLIPLLICLILVAVFVQRANRAKLRSHRLARLGVVCGPLLLSLLCVLTFARGPEGRPVFIAAGVVAIIAGIVAVTLAIKARSVRKSEGSAGGIAGPLAALFGIAGVVMGGGMIGMPLFMNPVDNTPTTSNSNTAWNYRVEPPGFEITMPSDRWRKIDKGNEIAFFVCPNPQMITVVKEVRPAAAPAGFELALSDLKRLMRQNKTTTIEEKREANSNGHEHWRFIGEEQTPNGRVFVAISATWWKKSHVVIMLFEGQHRMASQAGQDQESEGYLAAARSVLSSVK